MTRIAAILLALVLTFFACLFFGCAVKKKSAEKSKTEVVKQTESQTDKNVHLVDKSQSETKTGEKSAEEYTEKTTTTADSAKVNKDGSTTLYNPKTITEKKGIKKTEKQSDDKKQKDIDLSGNESEKQSAKSDSTSASKIKAGEVKGQTFGQSFFIAGAIVLIVVGVVWVILNKRKKL